jgi:pimeloyl-ACP methyl ester carboxylesterase
MTSSTPQQGTTVVLVHGAFADAGSWVPVTERLVSAGVPVMAIVNPLRGLKSDAAYVACVISQIPGPVLAVGHSYGGAVITNAVPETDNVTGLVYVAAFAPDEGGSLAGIVGRSKDSDLQTAVLERKFPLSQRPIAASDFAEETGHPAWKNLPSWAAVGTADKAAGSDVVRSMAQRAGARITEIDGSHVIMISQPDAVTEVILTALSAVS